MARMLLSAAGAVVSELRMLPLASSAAALGVRPVDFWTQSQLFFDSRRSLCGGFQMAKMFGDPEKDQQVFKEHTDKNRGQKPK